LSVGLYHGTWTGDTTVEYVLPSATVDHPLALSIVALHFNRTGHFLYIIRGPDLYIYDNSPDLVRLPDHDDTTIVKNLPQATRTNIQNFLDAAQIPLTSVQKSRLANMAWNDALKKFARRLIHPVASFDDLRTWLAQDYHIHYIDIPNKGEDV
jgi:hypothetical protein